MITRICSRPDCPLKHYARNLCYNHYQKIRYVESRAEGTPFRASMADAEHFVLSKVDQREDGCWWWTGVLDRRGYGRVTDSARDGLQTGAHRFSYETFTGPIPDGLTLDHLCRNTTCVNPDHLEPVSQAENNRRAAEARTTCPSGHPWDEENTRLDRSGWRRCRACARDVRREQYRRQKEARALSPAA